MTTRDQAVAGFVRCIAEGYRRRDSLSVEDAAQAAYTPTGPSIAELEAKIRAQRAQNSRSRQAGNPPAPADCGPQTKPA